MPGYPVSSEKIKSLERLMRAHGVREEEIEEKFVRSSGAGGQKVNKSSSCVFLHHRPTGIRIKCQISRSQALNRYVARRLLVEKIRCRVLGQKTEAQKAREKIRRQKRRRSRRAKEKMLANKKHQAQKKAARQKPDGAS